MNLKLVFRINAIITLINAVGLLFATAMFVGMAGLTLSPSLITVCQFMGVTFLFLALLSWRIPEVAESSISALGQLFGIGSVLWTLIVLYHIVSGQISGPTAYGNVIFLAVFATLFFVYSKKTD